jgi:hypothetical protein
MKKKYFGTDGIRGTVNSDNINGEKFFKFGLAAGTYFKNLKKKKQIAIIAKDTRIIWIYTGTCFSFWISLSRHAYFYFRTLTNEWFGNAYKKNESKYGNYDHSIS